MLKTDNPSCSPRRQGHWRYLEDVVQDAIHWLEQREDRTGWEIATMDSMKELLRRIEQVKTSWGVSDQEQHTATTAKEQTDDE